MDTTQNHIKHHLRSVSDEGRCKSLDSTISFTMLWGSNRPINRFGPNATYKHLTSLNNFWTAVKITICSLHFDFQSHQPLNTSIKLKHLWLNKNELFGLNELSWRERDRTQLDWCVQQAVTHLEHSWKKLYKINKDAQNAWLNAKTIRQDCVSMDLFKWQEWHFISYLNGALMRHHKVEANPFLTNQAL